jgi:hypothetical protein
MYERAEPLMLCPAVKASYTTKLWCVHVSRFLKKQHSIGIIQTCID